MFYKCCFRYIRYIILKKKGNVSVLPLNNKLGTRIISRKYQLTLKIEDKKEDVSLSGEIEDDDWEILSSFILYTDELLQTNLVRQGMAASSNVNWKQDSKMIFTTKLPPWDDVIVFLHRFRPLGLQSENTNFYKVHNLLAKLLPNSNIRSVLAKNSEYFSDKKMQSMLRISIMIFL